MSMTCNVLPRTMFTGDCLDVMRGMNSKCVDLIYLDPPFNSKHDYAAPIGSEAAGAAFKDTWTLNDIDLAWLGLIAEQNPNLYKILDATMTQSDRAYLIYMAVRLLEMHRILKHDGGGIYLHCDSTMSHWLKLVMDSIFGKPNFRNEIVWQRYGSHNDARKYGRVTDSVLYYAGKSRTWNHLKIPLSDDDIEKRYRNRDERGPYTTSPLHARTLSGGGMNTLGRESQTFGNSLEIG